MDTSASPLERHNTFLRITDEFKPIFRHFFIEYFGSTRLWFARRLNYTRRSVCYLDCFYALIIFWIVLL